MLLGVTLNLRGQKISETFDALQIIRSVPLYVNGPITLNKLKLAQIWACKQLGKNDCQNFSV
jgi:hypothetical protein